MHLSHLHEAALLCMCIPGQFQRVSRRNNGVHICIDKKCSNSIVRWFPRRETCLLESIFHILLMIASCDRRVRHFLMGCESVKRECKTNFWNVCEDFRPLDLERQFNEG